MKYARLSEYPQYFKWKWSDDSFSLNKYLCEEFNVYDCDECGESTSFWVVQSNEATTFYRCIHSWYWADYDDEPEEGGYGSYVHNEFEIEPVSKETMLAEDKYGYIKENLKYLV